MSAFVINDNSLQKKKNTYLVRSRSNFNAMTPWLGIGDLDLKLLHKSSFYEKLPRDSHIVHSLMISFI